MTKNFIFAPGNCLFTMSMYRGIFSMLWGDFSTRVDGSVAAVLLSGQYFIQVPRTSPANWSLSVLGDEDGVTGHIFPGLKPSEMVGLRGRSHCPSWFQFKQALPWMALHASTTVPMPEAAPMILCNKLVPDCGMPDIKRKLWF